MSAPQSARSHRPPGRFTGLPVWSAIAIIVAALATGLLLSVYLGTIGWPYLLCFAVSSILMALLVNPKGIFLTVASIPLLFGIATVLCAWSVSRSQASEGAPILSRATAVTSLYPLTQLFPWLAAVTVIAAVIGILRIWLLRRNTRTREQEAADTRLRDAEADRRNRALAADARRRSGQVTVEELLARNRGTERSSTAVRRPRRDQG